MSPIMYDKTATVFIKLSYQYNRLDQKDKINFEVYDVTNWLTNKYNTPIAQCLTKLMQRDNGIWSGSNIQQENTFSSKIMKNLRKRDQFQTFICLLKRFSQSKSKWSVSYFQYISKVLNLKTKKQTLKLSEKGLKQFLHHILCMIFQEKCFSCNVTFINSPNFLNDWFYLLRYWSICVLQLLVNQI